MGNGSSSRTRRSSVGPVRTLRTPLLGQRARVGFREPATETMQNETTRGLETPARQQASILPIAFGTPFGTSEFRHRTVVSTLPEPNGTTRRRLLAGTFVGSDMATESPAEESDVSLTTEQNVVYRTVQESPSLLGRIVGPTFTSKAEAKRVVERFAEEKLNATPTTWEAGDDGAVTMTPSATRHKLTVEPVTIHDSADDLTGVLEADE